VRIWDVDAGAELLRLPGTGSELALAWWMADGNTILAGTPWQAWRAPSWSEIDGADRKP
jgi:hypothetical protein